MKSLRFVVLAALVSACASLPVKQKAVVSLQASEMALEASHDAERALCSPNADKTKPIQHCDGSIALKIGLTDAKHKEIAGLYVTAFDAQLKAATALKAWRAGDPYPTTVAEYQHGASDILILVAQVFPKSQATVTKAQQAVNEAAKIAALLGGK